MNKFDKIYKLIMEDINSDNLHECKQCHRNIIKQGDRDICEKCLFEKTIKEKGIQGVTDLLRCKGIVDSFKEQEKIEDPNFNLKQFLKDNLTEDQFNELSKIIKEK